MPLQASADTRARHTACHVPGIAAGAAVSPSRPSVSVNPALLFVLALAFAIVMAIALSLAIALAMGAGLALPPAAVR
jgi:hypothetical protein